MRSIQRPSGIRLILPDYVELSSATDIKRDAPLGRIWDSIPIEPEEGPTTGDPVVQALLSQEMQLVDATELTGVPTDARRGIVAPEPPPSVEATVGEGESAAVLFMKDGVYSWGIQRENKLLPSEQRGGVFATGQRSIRFEPPPAWMQVGSTSEERAIPGLGLIVGAARIWVMKFAAPIILGTGVRVLERHISKRLVAISSGDPSTWPEVDVLPTLPLDRPPRILLFVHGTFSSTIGSYGALAASPWGRELLEATKQQYDAIIGYDHPTLSEDPLENASDLLARLERLGLPRPARIDAVAFSRGALVLRSLVEYLLPQHPNVGRIERAVFVGSTNAGTELARAENWSRLVDLYTNLAVAGANALKVLGSAIVAAKVFEESVRALGALVKALADSAIVDNKVPGLSSMAPNGDFVEKINQQQPGQPSPAEVVYSVVTSNFNVELAEKTPDVSLSTHLLQWLLDSLGDQLMRQPNDLVVNTASMDAIDKGLGDYVKARFDFGKNPHVYHTIYFTRPETVAHIREQLRLDDVQADRRMFTTRAVRWAPPGNRIVEVRDTDLTSTVLARIATEEATWVIVSRADLEGARYAFRAEEIIRVALNAPGDSSIRDAIARDPELELHEDAESKREDAQQGNFDGGGGDRVTARRTIQLDNGRVIGVLPAPDVIPSIEELGRRVRWYQRDRLSDLSLSPPELSDRGLPGAPPPPSQTKAGIAFLRKRDGNSVKELLRALEEFSDPKRELAVREPSPGTSSESASSKRDDTGEYAFRDLTEVTTEPPTILRDCYLGASMPGTVASSATVDVQVVVSLDDVPLPVGDLAATAMGQTTEDVPVEVTVIPKKRFTGVDRVETVKLDETSRTARFVFALTATEIGHGEIWVQASQAGRTVARISLTPEVLAVAPQRAPAIGGNATGPTSSALPPENKLDVYINDLGEEAWSLLFVLSLKDKSLSTHERSAVIKKQRRAYIEGLYDEIQKNYPKTQEGQQASRDELRAFGEDLLADLMPAKIRDALWGNRESISGIQLVSEEPFIPWELLYVIPPRKELEERPDGVFLAELGLVRWLFDQPDPPLAIRAIDDDAFYVIPDYPSGYKLAAAQQERVFLENQFKAKSIPPTPADVIARLRTPDAMNLFHFSGHGVAPSEQDEKRFADALMTLAGTVKDNRWSPEYLSARVVQSMAQLSGPAGKRPIVTLNACQLGRMQERLHNVGGFTPAFLSAGAGVFTAALWSIGDEPAKEFAEAFYSAFITQKKPLSESVSIARKVARDQAPDTWLSYAVYGHPRAQINA